MSGSLDPNHVRARRRLASLTRERDHLREQIEVLHEQLGWVEEQLGAARSRPRRERRPEARLDALLSELDDQLERAELERRQLSLRLSLGARGDALAKERLELTGQERDALINLFVAGTQLREAKDIERVHAAILEVVINLIGCEQVGLFERQGSPRAPRFVLSSSLGLSRERSRDLELNRTFIGRRLASGEAFAAAEGLLELPSDRADGLSVCLPLEARGEVVAVLLMFALLPHKEGLTQLDLELLELLREHAGPILARAQRPPEGELRARVWTQA